MAWLRDLSGLLGDCNNDEDRYSNAFPVCGDCLWARGVIHSPQFDLASDEPLLLVWSGHNVNALPDLARDCEHAGRAQYAGVGVRNG